MKPYTKKRYLKELKSNPFWEVEPHFFHYALTETLDHLETAVTNDMTPEDLSSALYGIFEMKGKPMREGFIQDLNFNVKLLKRLMDNGTQRN